MIIISSFALNMKCQYCQRGYIIIYMRTHTHTDCIVCPMVSQGYALYKMMKPIKYFNSNYRSLQENVSPKQLEKKGVCITKLSIEGRKTSLYGRLILTLKPSNVNKTELPSHNITTGTYIIVLCSFFKRQQTFSYYF